MDECKCKPYWSPPQEPAPECNIWQILDCAGDAEGGIIVYYKRFIKIILQRMIFFIADSMKLTPDDCNCDQPCESVSYDHKLSYATYPSLEVGEILAKGREEGVSSEDKEIGE